MDYNIRINHVTKDKIYMLHSIKMELNVKDVYKKHDKKTQEYMQNVIDCLKQEYKEIPSSWRISLDLIADNYDLYLKAKKDMDENGLVHRDNYGRIFKNQNFQILNTCQNTIVNLLKQFGATPMSKSKMKEFDSDNISIEDIIK